MYLLTPQEATLWVSSRFLLNAQRVASFTKPATKPAKRPKGILPWKYQKSAPIHTNMRNSKKCICIFHLRSVPSRTARCRWYSTQHSGGIVNRVSKQGLRKHFHLTIVSVDSFRYIAYFRLVIYWPASLTVPREDSAVSATGRRDSNRSPNFETIKNNVKELETLLYLSQDWSSYKDHVGIIYLRAQSHDET